MWAGVIGSVGRRRSTATQTRRRSPGPALARDRRCCVSSSSVETLLVVHQMGHIDWVVGVTLAKTLKSKQAAPGAKRPGHANTSLPFLARVL